MGNTGKDQWKILVLMVSVKKITPAESQDHSINIDDFLSKPVNPLQLPDPIQQIFFRRHDIVLETLAP